jgi:hypothetical protein
VAATWPPPCSLIVDPVRRHVQRDRSCLGLGRTVPHDQVSWIVEIHMAHVPATRGDAQGPQVRRAQRGGTGTGRGGQGPAAGTLAAGDLDLDHIDRLIARREVHLREKTLWRTGTRPLCGRRSSLDITATYLAVIEPLGARACAEMVGPGAAQAADPAVASRAYHGRRGLPPIRSLFRRTLAAP